MSITVVGTTFPVNEPYGPSEIAALANIKDQIQTHFPNDKNLLISMTWFGPQFDNMYWEQIENFKKEQVKFDNVFLLATVDPPMIGISEIQQIKFLTNALCVYLLGNFDSPHAFNFFAPVVADKFVKYTEQQLIPTEIKYLYINYNRKPKEHRVQFVELLYKNQLDGDGVVTLGQDQANLQRHISIGEKHEDYVDLGNHPDFWEYGIPLDNFSLHRMDIWQHSFLYIIGATEFNPIDDLFCQQDTFKPMLGLRPFVINGSQKTYHWLEYHGFRTFNRYWSHIPIETGDVHTTLIQLVKHLKAMPSDELLAMYNDMLPDLRYNKQRFWEFSAEQKTIMNNVFK